MLHMHYATTADGIVFQGSSTHPTTSVWKELPIVTHLGPEGQVLKHEYDPDTTLSDLAVGQVTPVIHKLLYQNAFKKPNKEWFETHLEHPTGRLTMVVISPDDMEIGTATGLRSVGRDTAEQILPEPAVMQDGSLIYWAIEAPILGARYAMTWTWSPRDARPPAMVPSVRTAQQVERR
jgi:hypothetical protein